MAEPATLRTTDLTYDDLPDPVGGERYELDDGVLVVTPSPRPAHQFVSLGIAVALYRFFGRAAVLTAPVDVIVTPRLVFVPDIVVVTDPALVSDRAVEGPPLLIVEVLSKSTARRDQTVKAAAYARARVGHYWIADVKRQTLTAYRLTGPDYVEVARAAGPAPFTDPAWPGLVVDLSEVWP